MAKYNTKTAPRKPVTNLQGGKGFEKSPEVELISLLATGLDARFYEMEKTREKRLVTLLREVDPYFAAQALVYTRSILGQRSISHRGAIEMPKIAKGEDWLKRFFGKWDKKKGQGGIVRRTDDMTEIISAFNHFDGKNGKATIPNSVKKGFASALENSDAYELAKYQNSNKAVSLIDVVNLVHPKPSIEMAETFAKLMKGELKQFNTVEDKNTKAGKEVAAKVKSGEITKTEAVAELKESKGDNYKELITSGKIGYLALLRNLRNIITTDTGLIDDAGKLMTNRAFVKKSLVFPHQIDLALEVIKSEFNSAAGRRVIGYLDKAYELSVDNVQELGFDEFTAVAIDTSASMDSGWGSKVSCSAVKSGSINSSPLEKASLIGATFAKGVNADMYQYSTNTADISYNPNDSINTLKNGVLSKVGQVGHGTNFESIFDEFNRKGKMYKRLFIISDGQCGNHTNVTGTRAYKQFIERCGRPYIYFVDLCGYKTVPFKENDRFFPLSGYSAQIYETAKKYEVDPKALVNEVKKIKI